MSFMREPERAERKITNESTHEQLVMLCKKIVDLNDVGKITSKQILSETCSSDVLSEDSEVTNSMHLRGAHWFIRYQGSCEFSVPQSVGMRYITALLKRPAINFPALHLRNLEHCIHNCSSFDFSSPLCDVEAIAAYRQSLREIKEDTKNADQNNDFAAVARLEDDRHQIVSEINRVSGLKGKIRETSEGERARKSVLQAINRARKNIHAVYPQLGHHLKQIKTGYEIVYCPEVEIVWDISTTI